MLDCLMVDECDDDSSSIIATASNQVDAAMMILKNFNEESGLYFSLRPLIINKVLSLIGRCPRRSRRWQRRYKDSGRSWYPFGGWDVKPSPSSIKLPQVTSSSKNEEACRTELSATYSRTDWPYPRNAASGDPNCLAHFIGRNHTEIKSSTLA